MSPMGFYDHHIELREPASRDGLGRDTGSATSIYDGPAEIQEKAVRQMTQQGQPVQVGDAYGALPEATAEDSLTDVEPGFAATVTRPDGTTFEATVADVTRLDNSFVLSKDRSS